MVLFANPTATEMYWLIADPQQPSTLHRALPKVAVPFPVWSVQVPPAGPPVVQAVVEAEPAEAAEQYGRAYWVKVFVTEHEEDVELRHLVSDDPLVPREEGETEVEWTILQSGPPGKGHNELLRERPVAAGKKSVVRRYSFYEYTGAYDPETHEVQCGGDGSCDFPLEGELGNYLGAQMAALNLDFLAGEPTPTSSPLPTPTPTAEVTPLPTEPLPVCTGDCGGDGAVTIDEVIRLVRIALGDETLNTCPAGDRDGDGTVSIDEIIAAVVRALEGCHSPAGPAIQW